MSIKEAASCLSRMKHTTELEGTLTLHISVIVAGWCNLVNVDAPSAKMQMCSLC